MGVVKKGARNEGDDGGWETSPEGDSRGIRAVVETVARQTARSHFPACHNPLCRGTMEQIRRLIYNERGIAIVVATVESNYFIVSINCSPARHAFRMLIINERDNASRPSPLACTPLPIPSLSQSRSQVTAQIFQCCFWTNFEFSTATIDFNHPQYLIHLNTNRNFRKIS